jgi:hypothetical protein
MPGIPDIPAVSATPAPGAMAQPADAAPTGEPVAGVAAAQLCGTDIAPTRVARPIPADTADPPRPGDPSAPIAEPTWLKPTALIDDGAVAPAVRMAGLSPAGPPSSSVKNPISPIALVTAGVKLDGFAQLPERKPFPIAEFKKLPAADPLCPLKRFNNPEIPVVAVFDPGANGLDPAADIGDASPCSALGIVETTCDSVDCTPALDDVPVAWATVPAWLAAPAALVVSGGEPNGVTVDAAAEDPA